MTLLLLLLGCGTPCDEPGTICTVAGTRIGGLGSDGGLALEEPLYWPADVTVAPDGQPWIVDWNNHRILRMEGLPGDFVVREVTGHGLTGDGPVDGPLKTARWNHPSDLVFREDGVAIMSGWHTGRVLGLDLANDRIEHIAGTGARAYAGDGGPAVEADFDLPSSADFGPDGLLYISDQANQRIRCIDETGTIVAVVGNGERGYSGDGGPALEARIRSEVSQNADPGGKIAIHEHRMYIADTLNNAIRVVDMDAWTIETLVGPGTVGPDGLALFWPRDVEVGPDGRVYIADTQNNCIRRLVDDQLETVAGVCGEIGFDGEGGPATEALLDRPLGIDVGPDGSLWIADSWNHVVRRVAPL